jgi:hypothetical protein
MIRVVMAWRVCGPGVCGTLSMMAGALPAMPSADHETGCR